MTANRPGTGLGHAMTPNTPNTTPDTASSPQTPNYDRTQSAHNAVQALTATQAEEQK